VALAHALVYRLPEGIRAKVGDVVCVTLRGKPLRGVVTEIDARPALAPDKVKEITALESIPVAPDIFALVQFVERYYRAPVGLATALALPPEPVLERNSAKNGDFAPQVLEAKTEIALNANQTLAAEAIIAALGTRQGFLLHGITGSGKTEVYVAAIRAAMARGEQSLVLVPEINLTPQWMARLAAQIPNAAIVALHSSLSDGERYRAWSAAHEGKADIVFGTRMAVFTPCPKLGLIIVDEEHDGSFKQQETPRYHARDVAVLRARARNVPIVLGSATPSLESFANAQRNRYRTLNLPERAQTGAQPPRIGLIPARDTRKTEGLSGVALQALDACFARGEQAMVFVNRRGFAPVMHCHICQWEARCVDCDARMVFHSFDQKLRCHHCGAKSNVPQDCPECGNTELLTQGGGTQKVEAFLKKRYAEKIVERADADSTRGKHSWLALYGQMAAGEIDLLVGTQMIAKGHDFPRLTCVIVLGADDALYSPDFRAPERLFAQLMQVAGRAGRAALPGEVLIQTDLPDHPVFHAVVAQDYAAFALRELAERSESGLPPAQYLAMVRAECRDTNAAQHALLRIHKRIEKMETVESFPPAPSPLARRATLFRWQLLVVAKERAHLHAALDEAQSLHVSEDVRLSIDVDAFDLN
jgi:primosomal protein N' (replication factor Y) (superfamily II helicase)